jgi:DNA-binding MarR family transcriptional regulator
LTDRGRQLIDQALDAGVETQRRLLADLPPGRRQQLNELLRDVLTVVTREASLPPASPARRSVSSET